MDKKKQEKKAQEEKKAEKTDGEKVGELTETLQRLQADFENYKKWVEAKKADNWMRGKIDLIKMLLPIIDQMEIALKNKGNENFASGIEMIFNEFMSMLKKEGLQPIECVGKKLDPYLHEVMLQEQSDKEEDTILEELQKGYRVNDVVIRHSKVKVCRK